MKAVNSYKYIQKLGQKVKLSKNYNLAKQTRKIRNFEFTCKLKNFKTLSVYMVLQASYIKPKTNNFRIIQTVPKS